jgi:hypothetical protein
MGEYKRVSAGAYAVETIAFEVKVQLSEAEIEKTYVASAKRNDWHVATLNDILGECNASSQTQSINSLASFEFNYYKCDCIGETCRWSSANDDERLGKLCSHNNSEEEFESDEDNQSYVCRLDEASSSYSWSAP